MQPTRERDRYFFEMGKAGATLSEAAHVWKASQGAQRYAVEACNRELTKREQARSDKLDAVLRSAPARLGIGWKIDLSGDPRGTVVKLTTPKGVELCP